jgi:pyridoxine 5-phosphate synthase
MIRLHVNVDHVATVRNARGTRYPDPVFAAQLCEQAGADGITMHLREDRRHIVDQDVRRARQALSTLFNLEIAPTDEMIAIADEVRPDVISLVPERREERTTEGGLDVVRATEQIAKARAMCERRGIRMSLFIEPDADQISVSHKLGAAQVEFHTGTYCHAQGSAQAAELSRLGKAAQQAHRLGLEVAAGHGLTRHNLAVVARIPELAEVNIGHALVADAIFSGLPQVVRDFRAVLEEGERLRGAR